MSSLQSSFTLPYYKDGVRARRAYKILGFDSLCGAVNGAVDLYKLNM